MNEDAAQITVEDHSAIFFCAALVPEKVQHARSDLGGERLVEVIFRCQEIQQTSSGLASWIEALGDVEAVGNGVLLVLQTQTLHAGDNIQ